MSKLTPIFPLGAFLSGLLTPQDIAKEHGMYVSPWHSKWHFSGDFNTPKTKTCECCQQVMKAYKRRVKFRQVRELIALRKALFLHNQSYVKVNQFKVTNDGEFAKLHMHKLVVPEPGTRGSWGISAAGIAFLDGTLCIPKYAIDYMGNVVAYCGSKIDVNDAWDANFDYDEMLGVDLDTMLEREESGYYDGN